MDGSVMECERCGARFNPVVTHWLCPECKRKNSCCEGAPQMNVACDHVGECNYCGVRMEGVSENTSDGYHTFRELYDHRRVLTAALFNEFAITGVNPVCKSWRHSDGAKCFGGGWFIVVAELPTGQISYHYEARHWDLFQIPEREMAPEYDGHDSQDVILRLSDYAAS